MRDLFISEMFVTDKDNIESIWIHKPSMFSGFQVITTVKNKKINYYGSWWS